MAASSWQIQTQAADLSGLVLENVDYRTKLQDDEVLVEVRAASLNYRDLVLAKVSQATEPFEHTALLKTLKGGLGLKSSPNVVLGSDGAGIVLSTGCNVTTVSSGDRVVTHLVPSDFPAHSELYPLANSTLPHMGHICAGLGQELDGTLTTHGVFKESCLVKLGPTISFEQAATLSCSGITAWNALMGLKGREVKKNDWILVQGTGGVSIAAMQVSSFSFLCG